MWLTARNEDSTFYVFMISAYILLTTSPRYLPLRHHPTLRDSASLQVFVLTKPITLVVVDTLAATVALDAGIALAAAVGCLCCPHHPHSPWNPHRSLSPPPYCQCCAQTQTLALRATCYNFI